MTTKPITPAGRAAGLREIAKDSYFNDWPEAREELLEAAELLDQFQLRGGYHE